MTGNKVSVQLNLKHTYMLGGTGEQGFLINNDTDYDVSKLIPKVKVPKYVADYIKYCKC